MLRLSLGPTLARQSQGIAGNASQPNKQVNLNLNFYRSHGRHGSKLKPESKWSRGKSESVWFLLDLWVGDVCPFSRFLGDLDPGRTRDSSWFPCFVTSSSRTSPVWSFDLFWPSEIPDWPARIRHSINASAGFMSLFLILGSGCVVIMETSKIDTFIAEMFSRTV